LGSIIDNEAIGRRKNRSNTRHWGGVAIKVYDDGNFGAEGTSSHPFGLLYQTVGNVDVAKQRLATCCKHSHHNLMADRAWQCYPGYPPAAAPTRKHGKQTESCAARRYHACHRKSRRDKGAQRIC
jgi:hypothetical protein